MTFHQTEVASGLAGDVVRLQHEGADPHTGPLIARRDIAALATRLGISAERVEAALGHPQFGRAVLTPPPGEPFRV